jgi:hypothetical protein
MSWLHVSVVRAGVAGVVENGLIRPEMPATLDQRRFGKA